MGDDDSRGAGLTTRMRAWHARAVKLSVIPRHKPYHRALGYGVAASTERARTSLPLDHATVLDIGANGGQFARLATRRCPRARLICVKPVAAPRSTLIRVVAHRPGVRVLEAALAASARQSQMFVSRVDDSWSLRAPAGLQLSRFSRTDVVDQVSFMTERLDALIARDEVARPTLLKIDVQGAELEVLIRAGNLLEEIVTILVEWPFVARYAGQRLADEVVRFATTYVDATGQVLQVDLDSACADA